MSGGRSELPSGGPRENSNVAGSEVRGWTKWPRWLEIEPVPGGPKPIGFRDEHGPSPPTTHRSARRFNEIHNASIVKTTPGKPAPSEPWESQKFNTLLTRELDDSKACGLR